MIRVGLDIHGVITDHPNQDFFRELTKLLVDAGHEVHVLSGPSKKTIKEELNRYGITYTHLFSIEDHHLEKGTPFWRDNRGNIFMDEYPWDKTKAEYCAEHKIDLHLDDSDKYNYFFKTPYSRFYSKTKRKHHIPEHQNIPSPENSSEEKLK